MPEAKSFRHFFDCGGINLFIKKGDMPYAEKRTETGKTA